MAGLQAHDAEVHLSIGVWGSGSCSFTYVMS